MIVVAKERSKPYSFLAFKAFLRKNHLNAFIRSRMFEALTAFKFAHVQLIFAGVYVRLVFNNPYAGELYLFFVTLLLFWFACVCGVCLCLSVNIVCFSKQYNKHHMGHKRKNRETNDSI